MSVPPEKLQASGNVHVNLGAPQGASGHVNAAKTLSAPSPHHVAAHVAQQVAGGHVNAPHPSFLSSIQQGLQHFLGASNLPTWQQQAAAIQSGNTGQLQQQTDAQAKTLLPFLGAEGLNQVPAAIGELASKAGKTLEGAGGLGKALGSEAGSIGRNVAAQVSGLGGQEAAPAEDAVSEAVKKGLLGGRYSESGTAKAGKALAKFGRGILRREEPATEEAVAKSLAQKWQESLPGRIKPSIKYRGLSGAAGRGLGEAAGKAGHTLTGFGAAGTGPIADLLRVGGAGIATYEGKRLYDNAGKTPAKETKAGADLASKTKVDPAGSVSLEGAQADPLSQPSGSLRFTGDPKKWKTLDEVLKGDTGVPQTAAGFKAVQTKLVAAVKAAMVDAQAKSEDPKAAVQKKLQEFADNGLNPDEIIGALPAAVTNLFKAAPALKDQPAGALFSPSANITPEDIKHPDAMAHFEDLARSWLKYNAGNKSYGGFLKYVYEQYRDTFDAMAGDKDAAQKYKEAGIPSWDAAASDQKKDKLVTKFLNNFAPELSYTLKKPGMFGPASGYDESGSTTNATPADVTTSDASSPDTSSPDYSLQGA